MGTVYAPIGKALLELGYDGKLMLGLDDGEWEEIIRTCTSSLVSIKRKKIVQELKNLAISTTTVIYNLKYCEQFFFYSALFQKQISLRV